MAPDERAVVTYESVPWAVFPSVLPRAVVVGIVYGAVSWFPAASVVGEQAYQVAVAVGVGMFLGVFALAYVGYRWRQYRLTPDGIAETRWVFGTQETRMPYSRIEDLTFTQSWLQSLYGVGTVRINHIETDETGDEEEMRLRYVETPETVFSDIRSALVDAGVADPVDVETGNLGDRGADPSLLSGDTLAADTSSAYLMPETIVTPRLRAAALEGALYGVPVAAFALSVALGPGRVVAGSVGPLTPVVLAALVSVLALLGGALWNSVRYNDTQYEVYRDHVRVLGGEEWRVVQYDDVDSVDSRTVLGSEHVQLRGDDDTLAELKHVENPDGLERLLGELVTAHS